MLHLSLTGTVSKAKEAVGEPHCFGDGKEEAVCADSCSQCFRINPGCKDLEEERDGKGNRTEERGGMNVLTVFQLLSKHKSSNNCSKIPKACV